MYNKVPCSATSKKHARNYTNEMYCFVFYLIPLGTMYSFDSSYLQFLSTILHHPTCGNSTYWRWGRSHGILCFHGMWCWFSTCVKGRWFWRVVAPDGNTQWGLVRTPRPLDQAFFSQLEIRVFDHLLIRCGLAFFLLDVIHSTQFGFNELWGVKHHDTPGQSRLAHGRR